MNAYFERIWRALSNSGTAGAVIDKVEGRPGTLPVIWLLGKTGAGKSSLVRRLTGLAAAEIGNGFEPCTRTAAFFDYPGTRPVVRFLDTRGLGEVDYDPHDDLIQCRERSHVVLALARLDDPVQGPLADVLATIRRKEKDTPVVVVHTGADLVADDEQRFRARSRTQKLLEEKAKAQLPAVEVAMPEDNTQAQERGIDELVDRLEAILPDVALLLAREDYRNAERKMFAGLRAEVLWYASAAGTSDIAPVVGAVTVPSIQAAMLRMLGKRYGVEWTRARLSEFAVALGVGAIGRYGVGFALRQAAKLIPGFGQSAGAAAAGTVSFATTYAMGRAAAFYLHRIKNGETVPVEELRAIYRDELKRARHDKK